MSMMPRILELEFNRYRPPAPLNPNNPKPEQILGLHLFDVGPGVLDFVAAAQPAVTKICDYPRTAPLIRASSPSTAVVYRHYLSPTDEIACLDHPAESASWFVHQFSAKVRPHVERGEITHVETVFNETNSHVWTTWPADIVSLDLAFIDELAKVLPRARPVVANIAAGNPKPEQYPLLLPLARAVADAGGAVGYHAYWPVEYGHSYLEDEWQQYAGHFERLDEFFKENGVRVNWLLSECGPCGGEMVTTSDGARSFVFDQLAGWRHEKCFDGDWNATLADINTFRRRLSASPAQVLGAALFTVCSYCWGEEYPDISTFNLSTEELATLTP